MNLNLYELLGLTRLTEVVDIGANPIDGSPPYKPMLDAGLCRVTGFEPQQEALAELQCKQGPLERYLPYAIGDGGLRTLNICRASGMSSLLTPDTTNLKLFGVLEPLGEVIDQVPVQTVRLDEVAEISQMDFLKMDIQGSELAVLHSGKTKLKQTVVVQVEVSFICLYKNQPTLGDIDLELRAQGFVPHCFAAIKKWPIAPCVINNNLRQPLNQLLEADLVYVRNFANPESLSDEQLQHLAMIAHIIYQSYDLALRCIMLLEQRNTLPSGVHQQYLQILNT